MGIASLLDRQFLGEEDLGKAGRDITHTCRLIYTTKRLHTTRLYGATLSSFASSCTSCWVQGGSQHRRKARRGLTVLKSSDLQGSRAQREPNAGRTVMRLQDLGTSVAPDNRLLQCIKCLRQRRRSLVCQAYPLLDLCLNACPRVLCRADH